MPAFGHIKRVLGTHLSSPATTSEGAQNLLCACLSVAILLGLTTNALLGLWWTDPLVALLVALAAAHVGIRTWRGTCTPAD